MLGGGVVSALAIVLLFSCVLIIGIDGDDSDASLGEEFKSKVGIGGSTYDMTFMVISESGNSGEVQVGNGTNYCLSNNHVRGALIIPSTVTSNGITFNVTSIGNSAFRGSSLSSVTMPDSVKSIGNNVFRECFNLTSVTMPSVESIGNSAFDNCRILKSVIMPDSVKSIGDNVFYECFNLTSVTMPSVKSIGDHAFYMCVDLTSVTMPSVESIGDYAFCNCWCLTSVTIPSTLKSIGNNVFHGCCVLAEVVIEGDDNWISEVTGGTNIGSDVFSDGYAVYGKKIHFNFTGTNVTKQSILLDAFNCSSYLTTSGIDYYNGSGTDGDFTWILNENVLTINGTGKMPDHSDSSPAPWNSSSCNKGRSIKEVIINGNVTHVGVSAFEGCRCLTSVTMPDSITSIGDYAFGWCFSLTSTTPIDSVTSIGDYAFFLCNLTSVDIPSVEFIGNYAFDSCYNLTSVTMPSVKTIGDAAFRECYLLTSVTIPDSVTFIGNATFSTCMGLTSVIMPDSINSIGDSAFYSCNLTSVDIPDGVISVGDGAFSCCYGLISVTIPYSVESIGSNAFYGCVFYDTDGNKISQNVGNLKGRTFSGPDYEHLYASPRVTLTGNDEISVLETSTDGDNYGTYTRPVTVASGSDLYIRATVKSGYVFVNWNDTILERTHKINNVTTDVTYIAYATLIKYSVTLGSNMTGKVDGITDIDSGVTKVTVNNTIVLEFTPGYDIGTVTNAASVSGSTYKANGIGNVVFGNAVAKTYTVTLGSHMTGKVDGTTNIVSGTTTVTVENTIVLAFDAGYGIGTVTNAIIQSGTTYKANGLGNVVFGNAVPIDHTLTYSVSGDIPSDYTVPDRIIGKHVGDIVTLASVPSQTGYTFAGWSYGGSIVTSVTMPASDVTVTGIWTRTIVPTPTPTPSDHRYTITFDGNGGIGSVPNAMRGYFGSVIILPDQRSLSMDGYLFDGWNTIIDGSGTHYDAGNEYTIYSDSTLYTQWVKAVTVTLLTDGNGSVFGSGTYRLGTAVTITATADDGNRFVRWSDGSTDATRNITPDSDITLTAVFSEDSGYLWLWILLIVIVVAAILFIIWYYRREHTITFDEHISVKIEGDYVLSGTKFRRGDIIEVTYAPGYRSAVVDESEYNPDGRYVAASKNIIFASEADE